MSKTLVVALALPLAAALMLGGLVGCGKDEKPTPPPTDGNTAAPDQPGGIEVGERVPPPASTQPTTAPVDVQRVDNSHPAVLRSRSAFQTGALFNAQFFPIKKSDKREEMIQRLRQMQAALNVLRQAIAPGARLELVDGLAFNLKGARGRVRYPLKGEDPRVASIFNLVQGTDEQAYVVYEVPTRNEGRMRLHLLMWKVQDEWRPANLVTQTLPRADVKFGPVVQSAQTEEKAGNYYVALALYELAGELAKSPPYRLSAERQILHLATRKLAQRLPKTQPVETLSGPEGPIRIARVGAAMTQGGPFVVLARPGSAEDLGEALNQRQISAAKAWWSKHPTATKYFGGVISMVVFSGGQGGGKGYRTVVPKAELEGTATQPAGTP